MESALRGASGMDAVRGLGVPAIKGHGWPLYAGPRSVDGMRGVERSEARMQGQAFLVTFFAPGKSDSPSRAKPMPQPTQSSSVATRTNSFAAKATPTTAHCVGSRTCTSLGVAPAFRPVTVPSSWQQATTASVPPSQLTHSPLPWSR